MPVIWKLVAQPPSAVIQESQPRAAVPHVDQRRFAKDESHTRAMRLRRCVTLITLLASVVVAMTRAADSTTQPAQSDLDFLLSQSKSATTQASGQVDTPTTEPASPFDIARKDGARQGVILLSNGEKINGMIAHTARKPVRVWVEETKEFKDLPFASIRSIDAKVVWEREQPEWHFKESGSDIKEYSGKSYPARETQYQITLNNGKTVTGGVVEPLYAITPDGHTTRALHQRDKGEVGQSLDQLVYVKRVEFEDGAATTQPAQ